MQPVITSVTVAQDDATIIGLRQTGTTIPFMTAIGTESTGDCPPEGEKADCSEQNCIPDADNESIKDRENEEEEKEECPGFKNILDTRYYCMYWPGESNLICEYVPFKNPENWQADLDECRATGAAIKKWKDECKFSKDPND
ncbi:hypothetical protein VTL71DRAFT_12746 [Oculimacula yallundae]|uniref:Uncharacterized protein n=1 Tax=Oculimacula yallundae TaxID=86028 RepID=A0ABR4CQ65_9HELO